MTTSKFQIGETVRVKDGVKEVDMGFEMGGWYGRISELDPDKKIMLIAFDSLTLRQMSMDYIEKCEEEGMSWESYYLEYDDVLPAPARDSKAEVKAAVAELSAQAGWAFLGEEGREINAILADVDVDDEMGQLEAWYDHLARTLKFPFKTEVSEWQDPGSLTRGGDILQVAALKSVDDLRGVLVRVKRKRDHRTFVFPLCDLEVLDKSSPNHNPVQLYAVWFANR